MRLCRVARRSLGTVRSLSTAPAETRTLSVEEVRSLSERALVASGLDEPGSRVVADIITRAEADQCKSHGLFRLPGYCRAVSFHAPFEPLVVEDRAPGAVAVDAKGNLAGIAFAAARPVFAEKAKTQGVATCAIRNCRHFSALWYETEELAAKEGLIALAFVGSKAFVAHAGGVQRTYGTNPMSFAFPRPAPLAPLVWDQASSVMARGEIMLAEKAGENIPLGAGITADGEPTLDPTEALAGSQLTFGGHKGTSIALMVELLASALTGSSLAIELNNAPETHPTANGEFVIAMDPRRVGGVSDPKYLAERAELLFEHIMSEDGARLPGDRRARARALTKENGVEVPVELLQQIQDIVASGE